MEAEEEVIKLRAAYVEEATEEQTNEVIPGKWRVLAQQWSSWAGNYWEILDHFDSKEEAEVYKDALVLEE